MPFETPNSHKIFCVFRDNKRWDIQVSEELYNQFREQWDNTMVTIQDKQWRILFEGKRREISEFRHEYPKTDDTPDEYKLYSAEYLVEKEKRNKFWKKHYAKMTQEQKDEVWSIIFARWWKTYKETKEENWWDSWKAYFRGMFQIIALELAGYKDKISSKDWIISTWVNNFEIPEMYWNTQVYRDFIK